MSIKDKLILDICKDIERKKFTTVRICGIPIFIRPFTKLEKELAIELKYELEETCQE